MTRSSTTELTPPGEHTAEAPHLTTVDDMPLQKTRQRKRSPPAEQAPPRLAHPRLTSREWDVLAALAEGLSTREISRRLQIKPSGVRAHISALVHKLGAADRDEAVALFRKTTAA